MKYTKFIYESDGVVTNNSTTQWNDLCYAIIDYIWDFENGLPIKENEDFITRKDLEQYFINQNKNIIIPEWIGNFTIKIDKNFQAYGAFNNKYSELENNKLNFEVILKERQKDLMYETLVHEFRHAYDRYIKLLNNIKPTKQEQNNQQIYKKKNNVFLTDDIKLIKNFTDEYLEINESIFQDPKLLAKELIISFYYTDKPETNSFLQQFYVSMNIIINQNSDKLKSEINRVRTYKVDFNNIVSKDKMQMQILQNISVTPYQNTYFRTYKSFQIFADKLKYTDIDIATEAFALIRKQIKYFLNIPIYKTLTHNDSETYEVLRKISEKEKQIYDSVINRMNNIFARSIIQFEENNL